MTRAALPIPMDLFNNKDSERFWAKVQKTETCWNWTAGMTTAGYGRFSIRHDYYLAHRVSYEIANGQIPKGMNIDHICHNTICVNPGHLRPVDQKQNTENLGVLSSNNKSGVRGVSRVAGRKKWRASVRHKGICYNLGEYDHLEDAAKAALASRLALFTHNTLDRREL